MLEWATEKGSILFFYCHSDEFALENWRIVLDRIQATTV